MFERIVVGVTAAQTAQDTADRAEQLARSLSAELHVVTVFVGRPAGDEPDRGLAMLESMAMASSVPMQIHAAPGDPAPAICEVARAVDADLIVVGNHGLHGSGKRSVTIPGEVSRLAPCSVLILDTEP